MRSTYSQFGAWEWGGYNPFSKSIILLATKHHIRNAIFMWQFSAPCGPPAPRKQRRFVAFVCNLFSAD